MTSEPFLSNDDIVRKDAQQKERALVKGAALEGIAIVGAVTGLATASLPITAISAIPAGLGAYILRKVSESTRKKAIADSEYAVNEESF